MLDGDIFHPGDALTVPEDPVATLLLPVSAPWLKLSEMIDYGRVVAPKRGYTIHDALFSSIGLQVLDNFLPMAACLAARRSRNWRTGPASICDRPHHPARGGGPGRLSVEDARGEGLGVPQLASRETRHGGVDC